MRFFRETVTVQEATKRLLTHASAMQREEVELTQADGRILAEDLAAPCAWPPFNRSAVDGYAVRAVDTDSASPMTVTRLHVVETIMAGDVPKRSLSSGEAARIMTGAMTPPGADAVIMFEQTENPGEENEWVAVKRSMKSGENTIRQGEEAAEQEILLKAGTYLNPGAVAVLATFGYTKVPVVCMPRVGLLPTGNELLEPHQQLVPGKIRDSNTFMLAALIRQAGGIPVIVPALSDDYQETAAAIEAAMDQVDVLITTGGVSVGDCDWIASFVDRDDVQILFNRVAMRPGSPTTAAVFRGKLLCALSGNPGACFTGFELFIRPLLKKMQCQHEPYIREMEAVLAGDYTKPCPYPRYLRGKLSVNNTVLHAQPDIFEKQAPLISLKESECLIIIPAGGSGRQAGERVTVMPIGIGYP